MSSACTTTCSDLSSRAKWKADIITAKIDDDTKEGGNSVLCASAVRSTTRSFLKTNLFGAIAATLLTTSAFSADQVDFSLITDKGWVQFTAGGDWKVLKMDTKNPVRVALFQLPNPADEGTSDSTNASVM